MVAQLRPTRLDVTDRFPMLGFTLRTDSPPRSAEIVLATDPSLFTTREGRNPSTFYSSREHGPLSIARGEAVYVVPPEVLARFVEADRLWFGLATASPPSSTDWTVDVLPTTSSPYISLSGLSDRSLRRVRIYPARRGSNGYGGNGANARLEWAGDRATPGMSPAQPARQGAAAAPGASPPAASAPADVPYDDGFGPLPPLAGSSPSPSAAAPSAPGEQAQALNADIDPETMGIEGPACGEDCAPAEVASGLALTTADYPGTSRVLPSPAFNEGRSGTAVDRIVIHITDAPTTASTVGHFTRAKANSSAHYLVGQDGEVVQFVSQADTAWHAIGANRRSVGIEHVAVKQGGATYGSTTYPYQPPTDVQYRASAELVAYLCRHFALAPDRATIIGHREAHPGTSHTSCPDGAWDWERYMQLVAECYRLLSAPFGLGLRAAPGGGLARGLGGETETVEIKYRTFIPAPAIKGPPLLPDYHGDGRDFSYSEGTSRGEIAFLVDVSPGGGLSNLRITSRHWGTTHAYDSSDTFAVEGKPDWWLGLASGAQPTSSDTVPTSDSNLRAYIGAPGTMRNVLATAEMASIVSIYLSGSNPLVPGSPAIDADMSVLLRRNGSGIEAKAYGSHDGFPAHELYVNGQRIHHYDPVAAGNGPSALFPPEDRDVDTSWVTVPALAGAHAQALTAGARGLSGDDWSINWDEVQQTAQPTDMSCWATAAAMLVGWRDRQSVDPSLIARFNGLDSSLTGGLAPEDKQRFADAIGLTVHPNACYTAEGFRDILEANGPVWVTAKVPGVHAIVVTGMYRENGRDYVRVTDPWDRIVGTPGAPGPRPSTHNSGSRYIMTYEDFAAEFEAAGDIDRIQLLHNGGTHGHVANRGSAAGAGYAQGLSAPARGLSGDDWSVNWDEVYLVAQPTNLSCWATAAAMIDGWRRRQSVSIDSIAEFDNLSTQNGLPPSSAARFAEAIGFTVHPNACYTPEGFRDILEANGPVWVAARVPGLHAIVVTGMYRENGRHFVRITDPWDRVVDSAGRRGSAPPTHLTGSQYIMSYEDFSAEYEAAGDTDFAQLLHTGGTHGHVINRGSATGAGYAQALASGHGDYDPSHVQGPFAPAANLTWSISEKDGVRYELAQLHGIARPTNPAAGQAPGRLTGLRVTLDDWPYVETRSGQASAGGVIIDFYAEQGGVGDVSIRAIDGKLREGWTARVHAEILPGPTTPERRELLVRVTTTFSHAGEEDQVGISEVTLHANGTATHVHDVLHSAPQARTQSASADAPERALAPAY